LCGVDLPHVEQPFTLCTLAFSHPYYHHRRRRHRLCVEQGLLKKAEPLVASLVRQSTLNDAMDAAAKDEVKLLLFSILF
jgi:hypothetical protein